MSKRASGRRPRWAAARIVCILAFVGPSAPCYPADPPVEATGVPLGGIGTGKIEMMPDGSFGNATINGNEVAPTSRLDGCFAAIWTRVGDKSQACVLQTKSPYGLPCGPKPVFRWSYPRSTLEYSGAGMPVTVQLSGVSPMVPQDLRASSLPVAFLEVEVRNPGKALADVSVAFSWEHLSGVGGRVWGDTAAPRYFGVGCAGNTIARYSSQDGLIGFRMEPGPIPNVPKERRPSLNTRGTYLFAVDGRGIDAQVSTAGWYPFEGALGGSVVQPVPSEAHSKLPGWWKEFAATGLVSGDVGIAEATKGQLGCVVAVKLTLRPGERRTIPFILAWDTPRRYLPDGAEYGRACLRGFDAVVDIARYAADNRPNLAALTSEWQERIRRSSLPDWLAARIVDDASMLTSGTLWTRDSAGEEDAPGPPVFGLLNGTAIGDVGARIYAQPVLSAMAPTLDAIELRRYLADAAKDGALHASVGDLSVSLGKVGRAAGPIEVASFVAQLARLYRTTGDKTLVTDALPFLRQIVQHLGKPSATDRAAETMAGALVLSAAADLAAAGGDPQASEWAHGAADWGHAAAQGVVAQALLPVRDILEVELFGAILDKQGLLGPVATTTMRDLVARDSAVLGPAPWRPRALWTEAAWLIGEGKVAEGLATAKLVADLLRRTGCICVVPQEIRDDRSGAPAFADVGGSASWLVLEALAGTSLDVPAKRLHLAPAVWGDAGVTRLPVFSPTFWATITRRHSSAGDLVGFRLDRVLPGLPAARTTPAAGPDSPPAAGLDIREVVLSRGGPMPRDISARLGMAPLAGTARKDDRGRAVFAFDPPIHLVSGQRLEFVLDDR